MGRGLLWLLAAGAPAGWRLSHGAGLAWAQEIHDEAEVQAEAAEAAAHLEAAASAAGVPSAEVADSAVPLDALPGAAATEAAPRLCPDIDDSHGKWEGSKKAGDTYTLECAPGYEVIGTRGNGTRGRRSATMVCPESLQWPEDLWCQDTDDCAELKHGCGPMGVCMDLVNGYDCNCERGYPRTKSHDGEIVCGRPSQQREVCGGHTCGSYGICIDLRGNISEFETWPQGTNASTPVRHHNELTYRCECVDGFYDNGETCVPHDCGLLVDKLGVWAGDTHTGGQYTLKCFPGASIWGGALARITITCGNEGKWLSHPVCVNPVQKEMDERLESAKYWVNVGMVFVCVCCAAMAAGLTLGLVSLDPFGLEVLLSTRPSDYPAGEERKRVKRDQKAARLMLPLVKDHHMLLVTLLLFNTVANEALPLFLDELVSPLMAVILSVSVVLICGEILPSAIFTGTYQFSIASSFVPFVGGLQCLFYPIARPIARLLDHLLPEEGDEDLKYNRAELRALLQLHARPPERRHEHSESEADDGDGAPVGAGASATGMAATASEQAGALPMSLKSVHPAAAGQASFAPAPGSPLRGSGAPRRDRALQFAQEDEVMDIERQEVEEPEEPQDAEQDEDAPRAVLAALEVQFIDGVFALRDKETHGIQTRSQDNFIHLCYCHLAPATSSAAEVLPQLPPGTRAVVLLNEVKRKSPTLRVRDVWGCVLLPDLLRGGRRPLSALASCSRALVSNEASALSALECLGEQQASAGIVIQSEAASPRLGSEGEFEGCEVLGVVVTSTLLSRISDGDAEPEDAACEDELHAELRRRSRMLTGSRVVLKKTRSKETMAKPARVQDMSVAALTSMRRRSMSAAALLGRSHSASFAFRSVSSNDLDASVNFTQSRHAGIHSSPEFPRSLHPDDSFPDMMA